MSTGTHRTIVVEARGLASEHRTQVEPRRTSREFAMDDREDEDELISLLLLREDRLRDLAALTSVNARGETA